MTDQVPAAGADMDMSSVDAQAHLAQALVRASSKVSRRTLRAAMFLRVYVPSLSVDVDWLLAMKIRQGIGTSRGFIKALEAIALENQMKAMNRVGGAGGK